MLIVLILLCLCSVSSASTGEINGTITREDSHAISHAFVILHNVAENDPEYHSHNWEALTDSNGEFSFTVQRGCYDVFVSAFAYEPYSKRVCVLGPSQISLKVKMKKSQHLYMFED